ncbi:MAG: hypothetical protein EXS05_12800 [Planctomycetaceae bacterium]|nr:hypothetical protein [Planctomycetaceae bacterium]
MSICGKLGMALRAATLAGLAAGVLVAPGKLDADESPTGQVLWAQLEKLTQPPAEFAGQFGPYRSPLQFADGTLARTREDWARRRNEILETWQRRLGDWPPLIERPAMKILETIERDGFTQHHVQVEVSPEGILADGYLLVPSGKGPFPAVFVPFYEPLTSIGQAEKGRGTHDYGWQLARRGFVTLSIGTPGSVETPGVDTRQLLTRAGIAQHRQPLGWLAYVAANCHTALAQRPDVDPQRIGIIGLSYGGKWSMFASCLHDKFACAVWSDPGIVFNEKNPSVNYWEPWYLGYESDVERKPGVPSADNPRTGLYRQLIEAGDDLVDLHALMAPRPVLVSGGTEDPPANWQALNHLVAVTQHHGYRRRVAMTARATHVPTAEALELELAFLEHWLKPHELQPGDDVGGARFLAAWGQEGSQPGEFNIPIGIAVNAADEVFVTDHYNNRVQKFSADGKLLDHFAVLPNPGGICVNPAGNLLIGHFPGSRLGTEKTPDRISVCTPEGKLLHEWGKSGQGEGELNWVGGIAVGMGQRVYVADQTNHRMQVFDADGKFLFQWGKYGGLPGEFGGTEPVLSRVGGPQFVAIDSAGNIYTSEATLGRIQKFTADGKFILAWGDNDDRPGSFGGDFLAFKIRLKGPIALCIDRKDRLWISSVAGRIQQFSSDGAYLRGFGAEQGSDPGQFLAPHGVALDSRGHIYVVDTYNHRVQKFDVSE